MTDVITVEHVRRICPLCHGGNVWYCERCEAHYPHDRFNWEDRRLGVRRRLCQPCDRERRRAYNAANPHPPCAICGGKVVEPRAHGERQCRCRVCGAALDPIRRGHGQRTCVGCVHLDGRGRPPRSASDVASELGRVAALSGPEFRAYTAPGWECVCLQCGERTPWAGAAAPCPRCRARMVLEDAAA